MNGVTIIGLIISAIIPGIAIYNTIIAILDRFGWGSNYEIDPIYTRRLQITKERLSLDEAEKVRGAKRRNFGIWLLFNSIHFTALSYIFNADFLFILNMISIPVFILLGISVYIPLSLGDSLFDFSSLKPREREKPLNRDFYFKKLRI